MKLTSRKQIELLAKFRNETFLTTSFYFDTNKSRMSKKEIKLNLKNLISSHHARLSNASLDRDHKESLLKDLSKIKRFTEQTLPAYNFAGLALFSCSQGGLWQEFNLSNSPRNRIIIDHNPYVRPLSAILDEHHRICVLTLSRKESKWYDIFMGEIRLIESLKGDVPGRIREGGFEGYESKRIERRTAGLLRDYFKQAAKITSEILNKNSFDRLFVGCPDEYYAELQPLFHPYSQARLKGRLKISPNDTPSSILDAALKLKDEVKTQEKQTLVRNFASELEKGGMAVSGLKNTLRSLNRSEIQTLLITQHYSHPGKICHHCNTLFVDAGTCPACRRKTESIVDVVDEAVELAMDKRCRIKHIKPPSELERYGNIGALLRFKVKSKS